MKKITKSIISIILAIMALLSALPGSIMAQAGTQQISPDGFGYIVSKDTTGKQYATITDYTGNEKRLVIPSKLNGISVKYIQSLKSAKNITALVIPSGIEGIGTSISDGQGIDKESLFVLGECDSLREIALSGTVKYIGAYAFFHCKNLKEVNFSEATALTTICKGAFMKCRLLDDIAFNNGLINIEENAFSGCSRLKSITLNSNLKAIGERAFAYCAVKSFYIPSGVERFGQISVNNTAKATHRRSVLHGCKKLREVTVSEQNKILSSVDGILFSKDKSILCYYPPARDASIYTVPSEVTEICDFAFNYSANLKSVIVSPTVTKINDLTFYRCRNIDSVVFAITPQPVSSYDINNNTSLKSSKAQSTQGKVDSCSVTDSRRDERSGTDKADNTEKKPYAEKDNDKRRPYTPRNTFKKTKIVLLI